MKNGYGSQLSDLRHCTGEGTIWREAVTDAANKTVMKLYTEVDLIDFQSRPDEQYKFMMVYYLDHLTNFVVLRALKRKCEEEVAYKLVDIFTLLGALTVLQSYNGREFANNVGSSLKSTGPP
ncbi:integrase core domain protein [Plakobranchus ocellatus]|uniref:Integrase core domain protein n=1 Tax=Plakobranchus ocellatus TaxID=259542 RepID=A0AAV4AZW4_9GAST|nr:integrase core domain protein [Plakobranchus ocellatus]